MLSISRPADELPLAVFVLKELKVSAEGTDVVGCNAAQKCLQVDAHRRVPDQALVWIVGGIEDCKRHAARSDWERRPNGLDDRPCGWARLDRPDQSLLALHSAGSDCDSVIWRCPLVKSGMIVLFRWLACRVARVGMGVALALLGTRPMRLVEPFFRSQDLQLPCLPRFGKSSMVTGRSWRRPSMTATKYALSYMNGWPFRRKNGFANKIRLLALGHPSLRPALHACDHGSNWT